MSHAYLRGLTAKFTSSWYSVADFEGPANLFHIHSQRRVNIEARRYHNHPVLPYPQSSYPTLPTLLPPLWAPKVLESGYPVVICIVSACHRASRANTCLGNFEVGFDNAIRISGPVYIGVALTLVRYHPQQRDAIFSVVSSLYAGNCETQGGAFHTTVCNSACCVHSSIGFEQQHECSLSTPARMRLTVSPSLLCPASSRTSSSTRSSPSPLLSSPSEVRHAPCWACGC